MLICNNSRKCKEKYEQSELTSRCLHIRPHKYDVECDKKLKKAYGWKDGIGCYYYPNTECIEIK